MAISSVTEVVDVWLWLQDVYALSHQWHSAATINPKVCRNSTEDIIDVISMSRAVMIF